MQARHVGMLEMWDMQLSRWPFSLRYQACTVVLQGALHAAALEGAAVTCRALIEHSADVHAADNQVGTVSMLPCRHAPVLARSRVGMPPCRHAPVSACSRVGMPPCRHAPVLACPRLGMLPCYCFLYVNTKTQGWTALHCAAMASHADAVAALVSLGADAAVADKFGYT